MTQGSSGSYCDDSSVTFPVLQIWVLDFSKSNAYLGLCLSFCTLQTYPAWLTTALRGFVKKKMKRYLRCWGIRVAEEAAEVEWEQQARDFWIGESPSSLPCFFTFWWLSSPWVSSPVPRILQLSLHVFLHLYLDFPERFLTASFPIPTQSPKIASLICLFFNLLFWKETLMIFQLKRHSV